LGWKHEQRIRDNKGLNQKKKKVVGESKGKLVVDIPGSIESRRKVQGKGRKAGGLQYHQRKNSVSRKRTKLKYPSLSKRGRCGAEWLKEAKPPLNHMHRQIFREPTRKLITEGSANIRFDIIIQERKQMGGQGFERNNQKGKQCRTRIAMEFYKTTRNANIK